MKAIPTSPRALQYAKQSFATRRVPRDAMAQLLTLATPRAGDLLLARVAEISQHRNLHLACGRRSALYPDDLVIVSSGDRYAPDQFKGKALKRLDACDLLAAGGLAGHVLEQHASMAEPTRLEPLGWIADHQGRVINLAEHALSGVAEQPRVPTIAVLGASMNAGKTTTAAQLIHGLSRQGLRVGAAKVTGTGAMGDVNAFRDAGAHQVLDFTDAGFPSTYRLDSDTLARIFTLLTGELVRTGAEVLVLEVADGLYQPETAALIDSGVFRQGVDGVILAVSDAMGAVAGHGRLMARQLPLLGLSGVLSASPLACDEASTQTGLPVLDLEALARLRLADLHANPHMDAMLSLAS